MYSAAAIAVSWVGIGTVTDTLQNAALVAVIVVVLET
jgi:hypothetical protein